MNVGGKVALITGAAMGMGRGFVEALLQAGAKVCIVDYNEESGNQTVSELGTKYGTENVIFCKCNIVSQTEFEDAFKKTKDTFGNIDIVVNNAGVGGEADNNWERTVDINMKGTLRGIRLAMHYLSKSNGGNGGVIINMASAAGISANPFSPVYGCTKAGIVHATRCYAISSEAVSSGIRLNVLCPAFVDTPMLKNLAGGDSSQTTGSDQAKVKGFIEHVGVMTVEEVAAAFMELVSDDTKNGAILKCYKKEGNSYCTISVNKCE